LGHVRATRVGRVIVEPAQGVPNLRFVVDFDGKAVESLSAKQKLSAKIEHGEDVTLVADSLFKNAANGSWRLVIEIADPGKAVDLRAFLMRGEEPITETWTFTWQP
jgi:glucans biosynthesis protein